MPPPPGMGGSSSRASPRSRASVVSTSAAIDAAFCSAERVTLAGSMMPGLDHVAVLAGGRVEARAAASRADLLDDRRAPS